MSEVVIGLEVRVVVVPATAAVVTPATIIHVTHAVAPSGGDSVTVVSITSMARVDVVINKNVHVRVVIAAAMMAIRTMVASVPVAQVVASVPVAQVVTSVTHVRTVVAASLESEARAVVVIAPAVNADGRVVVVTTAAGTLSAEGRTHRCHHANCYHSHHCIHGLHNCKFYWFNNSFSFLFLMQR